MKTPIVSTIALACAGFLPLHGEEAAEAEVVKPRVSHEQLSKRQVERANPLTASGKLQVVAPDAVKKGEKNPNLGGLIGRSTILAYGGHWTIVPRGAVLYVPDSFRERVVSRPSGQLLPWKQFFARNRGWIHTQEVDLENARGEKALSEEAIKLHRQLGRVVIAALHNGPISVKAPVVDTANKQ